MSQSGQSKHSLLLIAVAFALVCGLAGSCPIIAKAPPVTHAASSGHWAELELVEAVLKRFLLGYPDGSLRPDGTISRAEFCALVVRMAGREKDAAVARRLPSSFSDVDVNHWGKGYLEICLEAGIIEGTGPGLATPERDITRAEAVTMLDRYLSALGFQFRSGESVGFRDSEEVPGWAVTAASRLAGLGVLRGDVGLFRPGSSLTRAEAVALLLRVQDVLGDRWDFCGVLDSCDTKTMRICVNVQGELVSMAATDAVVFRYGKPGSLFDLRPGDPLALSCASSPARVLLIHVFDDGTR